MPKRMFSEHKDASEILVDRAELLRAEALRMPPGIERDRRIKQARQVEVDAQADRWANSTGLQPPTRNPIMPHVTSKSWTETDIARLKKLAEQGASVNRAAAALNRKTEAVKKVCRVHGISLVGTRQAKVAIRRLYAVQ